MWIEVFCKGLSRPRGIDARRHCLFRHKPPQGTRSMLPPFTSCKSTAAKLCKVYKEYATEVHPSFQFSKEVKLQCSTDCSWTGKQSFFKNMCLFDYDQSDWNRCSEDNEKAREKQQASCVRKSFEPGTRAHVSLLPFLAKAFSRWILPRDSFSALWRQCVSQCFAGEI